MSDQPLPHVEYLTVKAIDSEAIDEMVTTKLKAGYELYGDPYVHGGTRNQVMVRRAKQHYGAAVI